MSSECEDSKRWYMNSSDSFLRGRSNESVWVSVRVRFFCTKLLCRCRDGRLSKKRGKKRILKPPETYFYKITAALWSSSPTNSDSVSHFFLFFFNEFFFYRCKIWLKLWRFAFWLQYLLSPMILFVCKWVLVKSHNKGTYLHVLSAWTAASIMWTTVHENTVYFDLQHRL